jgi:hypothetical protein
MLLCPQVKEGAEVTLLMVTPLFSVTDRYNTSLALAVVKVKTTVPPPLALVEPSRPKVTGFATA